MNIHQNLAGKTIEAAMTDGEKLILRTTDSHEFRIVWEDGEPCLKGVDVKIKLPPLVSLSAAGVL